MVSVSREEREKKCGFEILRREIEREEGGFVEVTAPGEKSPVDEKKEPFITVICHIMDDIVVNC